MPCTGAASESLDLNIPPLRRPVTAAVSFNGTTMPMTIRFQLVCISLAIVSASVAAGEEIVFPSDAGVVDVTRQPYGAVPNDGHDDAPAIQRALNKHVSGNHIFYFPKGVYDIGDSLLNRPDGDPLGNSRACLELRGKAKRNIFVGQSETGTVLRLMNNVTEEFSGGVVWFGSRPAQRFRNGMRHLTISVGLGHPQATGVMFNASNQGGLRHVTIRSDDPDGAGATGLDLGHTDEVGPLLVQHLTVLGFNRGIRCAFQTASQTFEHITLRGQREYGWTNGFSQAIFIRQLDYAGPVTAIRNGPTLRGDPGQSKLLLIDAKLQWTGTGEAPPAIRNQKACFLRNISAEGFRAVVTRELDHGRGNSTVRESPITQFIANGAEDRRRGGPFHLFPSSPTSLNVPIEEPPNVPWEQNLKNWRGPQHFAIGRSGFPDDEFDDTPSIQAAIDSGATTVYLPRGTWRVQGQLVLRNRVRHFLGCEARLNPVRDQSATVVVADGDEQTVLVEGLESGGVNFTHRSKRTLHLRHLLGGRYRTSRDRAPGKLFLTDVTLGPLTVASGQRVWARQLNIEGDTTHESDSEAKVFNHGGTAWILGMKTEDAGTVIKTVGGGRTELLGHLHVGDTGPQPRFVTVDSAFSAAVVAGSSFLVSAVETRNGKTLEAPNFDRADLYVAFPK